MDIEEVTAALWPGQARGIYVAHGGFRFDPDQRGEITVRAPFDAHLIQASQCLEGGDKQYLLFFSAPCGFVYRFDHVRTLPPKLAEALKDLPPAVANDSRTTYLNPPLWIEQGEVVGNSVGIFPANIFVDFGLYDVRAPNGVVPNVAWADLFAPDKEFARYGVCFFDYLPANHADIMRSLPTGKEGKTSDYCSAPAAGSTAPPTAMLVPTATRVPTPMPPATATMAAADGYVPPDGYDIFAPGGLNGDCESGLAPNFTSHITDLSKIYGLTRAGTVQGGDLKPHGYVGNDFSATEVPVYAPADAYLITYGYYGQGGEALYMFNFQVSCEVAYYFDHLREIVGEISALIPDAPTENSHSVTLADPIFYRAGDLIGYTGGTEMSGTWDFGVLNNQNWNELPTAEPFNMSPNVEKYRFAVCLYEYFEASIKAEYIALLGAQGCGP